MFPVQMTMILVPQVWMCKSVLCLIQMKSDLLSGSVAVTFQVWENLKDFSFLGGGGI